MAYKKIRHSNILGEKGTEWLIEVWQNNFTGTSTEFDMQGEGFEIKWTGQGGTRDRTFLGSECIISMYIKSDADEDFLYDDVLKKGERQHFIRIYKNSVSDTTLWWFGYIQPGFDNIQNAPYPYSTKITATDSYGYYTKLKESVLSGDTQKTQALPISLRLLDLITKMDIASSGGASDLKPNPGLRKLMRTAIDWWRPEDTYQSNDPFQLYACTIGAFTETTKLDDDGNISNADKAFNYKKSDVFNGALKAFNAVGFLAEGYYWYIQPNSLVNNNNGTLNVWERNLLGTPSSVGNVNTKITIDQSTNVILSGSILTYDPSYESVNINFILGPSTVYVTPTADLTSSSIVGAIQLPANSTDVLTLNFHAIHQENLANSNFSYATSTPGGVTLNAPATIENFTFLTTATLIISITDGNTVKYLQKTTGYNGSLVWTASNSPLSITLARGYNEQSVASFRPLGQGQLSTPTIVSNGFIVNSVVNFTIESNGSFPCDVGPTPNSNGNGISFRTDFKFSVDIPAPGIIGDVSIKMTATNDYSQKGNFTHQISSPGGTITSNNYEIFQINDPTPGSTSTTCQSIFISPENDSEFTEIGTGFKYSANQTEVPASESYDLGSTPLGSTLQNKLYSIQYLDSSNSPPQYESATTFQRGNPSTDAPLNISQLLVNEYLSLQVEPLEVLQASIQSADISPLKMLKYSINEDSSFKNYSFLGGTFKAQSEVMSGEWYKVSDDIEHVQSDDPAFISVISPNSQSPLGVLTQEIASKNLINESSLLDNSLATISSAIAASSSISSISVGSSLKADIAENQKLKLSYPDGSNTTEITVTDAYNDTATSLDVTSFIPSMQYPIGSILSVAPYNTSTLIQSLTTSGNVNNRSVGIKNIQEINFLPHDFNLTSNPSVGVASNDLGGSIRIASATANMYAQKLISKGKTITKVNIFGSANFAFRVYVGFIFNDTTTLVGSGSANTELDITDIVGTSRNYITIEIDVASASQEVYGGYALVINT